MVLASTTGRCGMGKEKEKEQECGERRDNMPGESSPFMFKQVSEFCSLGCRHHRMKRGGPARRGLELPAQNVGRAGGERS